MRRVLFAFLLFVAPVAVRGDDLAAYAGNYLLGHQYLAVAEWEIDPQAPHVLAFTDLTSGRVGVLTRIGSDEFSLSAGLMSGPQEARIRFIRKGGEIGGLIITASERLPAKAKRLPSRRIDTTVDSGGASLPATLLLPPGRGPFPAIVIVPAGRAGRMAAATFPNFFLSEGFAVLMYDRRAENAGFDTFSADAVAAAELLGKRSDIKREQIGLWGHSQGGWLAIMAASKTPRIAFVIDHSGMFVPAWQQELYRLAAEAMADGRSPIDIAAAVSFETQLMQVGRSGVGWNELMAAVRERQPVWHDLVYIPSSLEELQEVWRTDFSFDPRPFAAGVRQPVLALFGGLDRSTPIESAANLKRAMPADARISIVFFPAADHAFLEAITGGNAEIPTLTRFVPGMFATMQTWLRRTVLGQK